MLLIYAMKVAGEFRIFLSFLGDHSMIRKMEGKTHRKIPHAATEN